jgi:serine/threonine protein kinase
MNLKLDQHTKDPHLKNLIKGLLHPNPDLRISNFQEIKKSPWLADIDWKKI